MPSAFIVDDHAVIQLGLTKLFESANIAVAGVASTVEAFFAHFEPSPDVAVVLDLNLGSAEGVENISRVLNERPESKIIVYSVREELATVASAYNAGALAYVGKSLDPDYLIQAVHFVTSGGETRSDGTSKLEFYPPGLKEALINHHARSNCRTPKEVLTNRDFDTFVALAAGKTTAQLAGEWGVSVRTIRNKASTIGKALGINRAAFTVVARQYNYID